MKIIWCRYCGVILNTSDFDKLNKMEYCPRCNENGFIEEREVFEMDVEEKEKKVKYLFESEKIETCTCCPLLKSDNSSYKCGITKEILDNSCVRVKPESCPLIENEVIR